MSYPYPGNKIIAWARRFGTNKFMLNLRFTAPLIQVKHKPSALALEITGAGDRHRRMLKDSRAFDRAFPVQWGRHRSASHGAGAEQAL